MKTIQILTALFVSIVIFQTASTGPDKVYDPEPALMNLLTPVPGPAPRINGPLVYGCRPGHPFLYRIPCQGTRPVEFTVDHLPSGLTLDTQKGIISGTTPAMGEYPLTIEARNQSGRDKRKLTIVAGDKLALTPPMGYNHWYAHYNRITDIMMREAADIMISSGMADAGYEYVNIDDCWMNAPEYEDATRKGPLRDETGNIMTNSHFPDMKALTGYIHERGLKAGIYTSPGALTCGRFSGSYGHEEQDARQFAEWGFDFLKYDWCSYGKIASAENPGQKSYSVDVYRKPYTLMGDILKHQDRDIVFNLCQYGMGDVWKWGGEVGGHCWRTAGDLGFELDKIFDVALKNSEHREYSKPGEWNDPDYIQIGWIGNAREMGEPKQIEMPASMQYAYMSLWSLMAAPLVYSGDMTRLDRFTLNVLCNPEVIEVNQDPLGISAEVLKRDEEHFIMVKDLYDGTVAVGLFNRSQTPAQMNVEFTEIGLKGKESVRDLWRQKSIGRYRDRFTAMVPAQGVIMVKIGR
ncbi:MAG TPA: putative Ig domain-containing protein [Bacteroidales bacterium]|nr:putative Ig domain-containing protein [Bacteroidales bacterium]